MSAELTKWAIGSFAGGVVVIVSAVVFLLAMSFRIGKKWGEVDAARAALEEATAELKRQADRLAKVDSIERAVDQVEHIASKAVSDIKELLSRVSRLEGREQFRSEHERD